jgi:hypothetical protein
MIDWNLARAAVGAGRQHRRCRGSCLRRSRRCRRLRSSGLSCWRQRRLWLLWPSCLPCNRRSIGSHVGETRKESTIGCETSFMLLVARLRSIARQAGIYTHIGLHVFCSDEVMLHGLEHLLVPRLSRQAAEDLEAVLDPISSTVLPPNCIGCPFGSGRMYRFVWRNHAPPPPTGQIIRLAAPLGTN